MASISTVASPVLVSLPTPRPPVPRHRPISSNDPALACAPALTQARAPLPTHPKPTTAAPVAASAAAAIAAAKSEPVPIASIPSPDAKLLMTTAASMEGPKMSMTSKEWVIPPRPKPGRKPATDTPPTKRKAQNRAAQRAFRERRAARVGELEEQLDQYKQEYDKKELDLKDKIHSLELDVQSYRSRCHLLENMLDRERQDRIRVETEAETLRRRQSEHVLQSQRMTSPSSAHRHPHRHGSIHHRQSVSSRSTRLPLPGSSRDFAISQMITPPESSDPQNASPLADSDMTCGNCSPDGHCACAEEVLANVGAGCGSCAFGASCKCIEDLGKNPAPVNDLKRPSSPFSNAPPSNVGKRARSMSSHMASSATNHETDFTGSFSRYQSQALTPLVIRDPPPSEVMMMTMPSSSTSESMSFKDGCGFCKDGTYCACADAAMAAPAMTPPETQPQVPCQVQTPPPSETDVAPPPQPLIMEMTADGAVKLPPRKLKVGQETAAKRRPGGGSGCGSGAPGTCAQCQADPKSGLFCRLMNAKFGKERGGACCGGKGGGDCCKSKPANGEGSGGNGSGDDGSGSGGGSGNNNSGREDEKITLPSLPSLGLSCAEAYQTLASHRNFSQAANDINSWLPKLKATPRAVPLSSCAGKSSRQGSRGMMPIEVEAASIMSVLKEFDIRFGREC